MLLKLASMFLANIFYYPKVIFKIERRDTRLLTYEIEDFWVCSYELYDVCFKIGSRLANTKLRHNANKLVVHFKFLKHFSLLVCTHQNFALTTLG